MAKQSQVRCHQQSHMDMQQRNVTMVVVTCRRLELQHLLAVNVNVHPVTVEQLAVQKLPTGQRVGST